MNRVKNGRIYYININIKDIYIYKFKIIKKKYFIKKIKKKKKKIFYKKKKKKKKKKSEVFLS